MATFKNNIDRQPGKEIIDFVTIIEKDSPKRTTKIIYCKTNINFQLKFLPFQFALPNTFPFIIKSESDAITFLAQRSADNCVCVCLCVSVCVCVCESE